MISPAPDCVFILTSQTLARSARQFTNRAPANPYATLAPFTYAPANAPAYAPANGSPSAGDVYRYKQQNAPLSAPPVAASA